MANDPVIEAAELFSLVTVLVALVIFIRLAVKSRALGSLRFQLGIFISIWGVSEIPHIAETLGLVSLFDYETVGLALHALSMATFAVFVGIKSYGFMKIQPIPPSADRTMPTKPLTGKLGGD